MITLSKCCSHQTQSSINQPVVTLNLFGLITSVRTPCKQLGKLTNRLVSKYIQSKPGLAFKFLRVPKNLTVPKKRNCKVSLKSHIFLWYFFSPELIFSSLEEKPPAKSVFYRFFLILGTEIQFLQK